MKKLLEYLTSLPFSDKESALLEKVSVFENAAAQGIGMPPLGSEKFSGLAGKNQKAIVSELIKGIGICADKTRQKFKSPDNFLSEDKGIKRINSQLPVNKSHFKSNGRLISSPLKKSKYSFKNANVYQ